MTGQRIGYKRVSTVDQNTMRQLEGKRPVPTGFGRLRKDDPPGRRLRQGNQFLARDLFQDMSRRIDIRSGACLFVDQSCERALRTGEQLGDPSV